MIKLIIGDIPLLRDRVLARIKKEQGGSEPISLYGPDCTAKSLQVALINLSLLSDAPFVILREGDRFPRKEQELLRPFLKDVPSDACFVVLADKIDQRLKFWQELLPLAEVISVKEPSIRDRRVWLKHELKHRGLYVAPDAFEALVEEGAGFGQVLLLLDKLEIYLGESKTIDLQAVQACRTGISSIKIFELAEAVGAGYWKEAFLILKSLRIRREVPLTILSLLVRHYRILLRAVENRHLWNRRGEMAHLMGVPPFVVDRYLKQARNYKRGELISLWREFQAADRNLKSNPSQKDWDLEKLLLNLRKKRA